MLTSSMPNLMNEQLWQLFVFIFKWLLLNPLIHNYITNIYEVPTTVCNGTKCSNGKIRINKVSATLVTFYSMQGRLTYKSYFDSSYQEKCTNYYVSNKGGWLFYDERKMFSHTIQRPNPRPTPLLTLCTIYFINLFTQQTLWASFMWRRHRHETLLH